MSVDTLSSSAICPLTASAVASRIGRHSPVLAPVAALSVRARAMLATGLVAVAVLLPTLNATPASAREVTLEGDYPVAVRTEERSVSQTSGPVPQAAQVNRLSTERVQPSNRGASRATPDISTPQKFIAAVAEPAQESQGKTGAPASVTIAQAILESEWGRSGLSRKGQNYFGIKALNGPGPAGSISMDTWEVFGGRDVIIKDAFKKYNSLYESVIDHGEFLKANKRYARAFETSDPKQFTKLMHEAGYATDPAYCTKLNSLIDKYNLTQYDKLP